VSLKKQQFPMGGVFTSKHTNLPCISMYFCSF